MFFLFLAVIYTPHANSIRFFQYFVPRTPLGFPHGTALKLRVPVGTHLHFRTISQSFFFSKYNIRKLNLLPKTDISKTAWINRCNYIQVVGIEI